MKTLIAGVLFALSAALIATPAAFAAGPKADLEHVKMDLHDKGSLQRGAKYFINYCMTCHSTKFSRYNRVALDLGLTEEQVLVPGFPDLVTQRFAASAPLAKYLCDILDADF